MGGRATPASGGTFLNASSSMKTYQNWAMLYGATISDKSLIPSKVFLNSMNYRVNFTLNWYGIFLRIVFARIAITILPGHKILWLDV